MISRKQVLRIIAVLSVAVAAGHAVETLRVAPPGSQAQGIVRTTTALPDLTGITPVAAVAVSPAADGCAPQLSLSVAPGAMIDVALNAPCHAGDRVLVRHSGLSFTAQVGSDGRLALQVPALDQQALIAVYFEGSQAVLQAVAVPQAAEQARFAFQAAYPLQFDLRAVEAGRLFSGSKGGQGDGARRIVTLGTTLVAQPVLAQVYTFPAGDADAADLSVELRITPDTCSRSFSAETVLSRGGTAVQSVVPVAVPLCGTSGDILVLKNLLPRPTLDLPE